MARFPSDEMRFKSRSLSAQCAAAGPRQPGCVTGSGRAGGEPGPSYQHGPAAQPSGGQFTQLLALTLLHSTLFHSTLVGCSHHPVQGCSGLHCSSSR